ncbi:hypothetical protein MRB53_026334 [Persea americana]|uniref:Uncharacterized protein n=1 Tax=Persea americana TaxID=3435 RepID=A0ACC2LIP2_PERAE|nr:hypothetical protein MRB53_026334 [Persea americana]
MAPKLCAPLEKIVIEGWRWCLDPLLRAHLVPRHLPLQVDHFCADCLGELDDHALQAPNPDNEVRPAGLEGSAEVCDGFGVDDGGAGVKAKEGEEGEGVGVDDGGAASSISSNLFHHNFQRGSKSPHPLNQLVTKIVNFGYTFNKEPTIV